MQGRSPSPGSQKGSPSKQQDDHSALLRRCASPNQMMMATNASPGSNAHSTSGPHRFDSLPFIASRERISGISEVFRPAFDRLDGVVHNAGILLDERNLTPQGFEQAYATHLLCPYLLSCELFPLLCQEGQTDVTPSRMVWVSSGGMYTQRFDPKACEALSGKYDGVIAYAQQKRGQVLLQEAMQGHAAKRGIAQYAMHPGWADTPGVARSLPLFYKMTKPFLRTPDEGADTISWLLAGQAPKGQEGNFFLDRQARPKERARRFRHTAKDAEQVLVRCAELTGVDWREKCAAR